MASVERTPAGTWMARWRSPDGKSRRKTFRRKEDAKRHLTSVESQKLAGTYIDTLGAQLRLSDWWQTYDLEVPRRATTAARDRVVMGRWWLPALGAKRLGAIQPVHVRAVIARMAEQLQPSTVRTNLGVLRAVMNRAVETDKIGRSPVRGIRLPAEHRAEPRFLSATELHHLAEQLPAEYRAMVYVAGVLGLRWSEVAGLRVGGVDFLRRTITVAETMSEVGGRLAVAPPKSKASERTLTVPVELCDLFAHHLASTGRNRADQLVFTAPDGGPLRASTFRTRVWQPAVAEAGLDGLTFHGLRHSAVGFMIAAGVHPRVIQRRAGHASVRTTLDVYGRVLPEVDEGVATALGAVLGSPDKSAAGGALD